MITYYRLNQDNTILDFISNPSIRHPYLNLENVLQTDKEIMRGNDGKLYFAGEEPITPPPTPEQIQKTLTDAVQAHLDTKVKERGYDSILSACSYVNSSDPTFQAEALACVAWRDAVWRTCYNILDEVMAGEREIPTAEELIAELPELVWPDEIIPEWVPPEGAHDAYPAGAKVSFVGKTYISDIDNNIWQPGVHGWTET